MSGHSKWANIKNRKGKMDAARGKIFTKISKEITIAVKQGGADPAINMRLKSALENAKENNMPNDTIERAIKKGTGELAAENYEEFIYEGYGPGGAAVMLEIATDNRNRTAGDIRHIFAKNNGNLGETGCVSWLFEKKGYLEVAKEGLSEDDLMLSAIDAGAEDVRTEADCYEVITAPEDFLAVKQALADQNIEIISAEITMLPKNTIELQGKEAQQMLRLMEMLEDHDDVQNVYTNADIPDAEVEQYNS